MATDTSKTSTHEKFNADDADVTIQSSDGVQFRLHRKHLEAHTGAFPGADSAKLIVSDGRADVVHLTEPAEVLEILFEFVYPQRPPDLKDLEFKVLVPLAEAVEKYEVFAAMRMCEMRLRPFIQQGPLEILLHGLKHDYPQLINEAALQLSRSGKPLDDIVENLPSDAQMAWIRYHEAWRATFLMRSTSTGTVTDIPLCVKCKVTIMAWIRDKLEPTATIGDLKSRLRGGPPEEHCDAIYTCAAYPFNLECMGSNIIVGIRAVFDTIPPFTDFLADSRAAKMTDTTNKSSTHEKFNADDADVTIQSSDSVQFHLHRKHLEAHTGAFPGAEIEIESARLIISDLDGPVDSDSDLDVVHLTEPAEVLEILFEFVYPRRPPDLKDLEFGVLRPVAEAVEKYEAFGAMRICEVRLRNFIQEGPLEILLHGMKHDYPQLTNEAALQLSRSGKSLDDIVESLPADAQMAWIRYHEAWRATFAMRSTDTGTGAGAVKDVRLCIKCKGVTMAWIRDKLEPSATMDDLKSQICSRPPEEYYKAITACDPYAGNRTRGCLQMGVVRALKALFETNPPFTDFLKDSRAARNAAQEAREAALRDVR
ncbi:hypothetical protein GALMADRAFT_282919, partial [Galerina marginata CBS 339.88]